MYGSGKELPDDTNIDNSCKKRIGTRPESIFNRSSLIKLSDRRINEEINRCMIKYISCNDLFQFFCICMGYFFDKLNMKCVILVFT